MLNVFTKYSGNMIAMDNGGYAKVGKQPPTMPCDWTKGKTLTYHVSPNNIHDNQVVILYTGPKGVSKCSQMSDIPHRLTQVYRRSRPIYCSQRTRPMDSV